MNTCIGELLSEFSYNNDQQNAISDTLELSDTGIPNVYTNPCETKDLSEALEWLITTTQSQFFARSNERYYLEPPKWVVDNSEKIIESLEEAGFISKIDPTQSKINCVAILGATTTEMEKRISYVKTLIDDPKFDIENIFLLVGERYSTQDCDLEKFNHGDYNCEFIKPDGGIDYLNGLAAKNDIPIDLVTETHIAKDLYDRIIGVPESYVIDTPRNNKKRPNTEDTVMFFMDSPEYYKCSHTAFVSRAPNIKAQNTAIERVYGQKNSDKTFETIGASANIKELQNKSTVAHHILMPIAGTIYSQYVQVCKKISMFQDHCTEEYLINHLSYKAQLLKKESKEDL